MWHGCAIPVWLGSRWLRMSPRTVASPERYRAGEAPAGHIRGWNRLLGTPSPWPHRRVSSSRHSTTTPSVARGQGATGPNQRQLRHRVHTHARNARFRRRAARCRASGVGARQAWGRISPAILVQTNGVAEGTGSWLVAQFLAQHEAQIGRGILDYRSPWNCRGHSDRRVVRCSGTGAQLAKASWNAVAILA